MNTMSSKCKQEAISEYFKTIYLGRNLLATIGYNTYFAESIDGKVYYIIQRSGSRDIITRFEDKEVAQKRFAELLG